MIELKNAIYGDNVDLSEDDIMKNKDEVSVFARKMVKDLSKYVQFRDEDEETLKNL